MLPYTEYSCTGIPGALDRVHYAKCFSLPELVGTMHCIQDLLDEHPKVGALAT